MIRRRTRSRSRERYRVSGEVTNLELAKAGSAITLNIYKDREKLGELQVGRGSLYWFGRHRQEAKRIDWAKFAEVMSYLAYGED